MRIGIDWGGTKIEGIALDREGNELWRQRISTPRGDYEGSIRAAAALIERVERDTGRTGTIGVGIPGTIVPATGLVKNANSTWLNGKPLQRDLSLAFGREVRCANDANCLALSEATDGAGAGRRVVFAAILGTGCGGGLAFDAHVPEGAHGVAGEWGHNPLPWQRAEEYPGPKCYCGRKGCIESWISGPSFEREYAQASGNARDAATIVRLAESGDSVAAAELARYENRLARALAHVVNVVDPDAIVLGGGMSKIAALYKSVPASTASYIFGGGGVTPILPAKHGDSSGVRGAAWLWPPDGLSAQGR
jgi:fructokinase